MRNRPQKELYLYEDEDYELMVHHAYISHLEKYCDELEAKETPKKPHLEGDSYSNGELVYDTWLCPNCEKSYEVDYEKYDYCPNCGQKIDWSEYE